MAAAQMEVALGRGEGASWGFGEDAIVDEDEEGVADVDWRTFSETRGLTDKQVMAVVHTWLLSSTLNFSRCGLRVSRHARCG